MADVLETDLFLVERDGQNYQTPGSNMAELLDDDLMLVERDGTCYKATGQEIKDSLGGSGYVVGTLKQPTVLGPSSEEITGGMVYLLSDDITDIGGAGNTTCETSGITNVQELENTWAGTQTGVASSGQMSNLWDGFSSTDTANHGCDVANSGDVRFTFDVPVPVTPGTWSFYNSGGANYTNIFSWEDDNGVHNMSGDPSGQIHGSGWGWDNFSPQPVGAIKWVQIGNSSGFGIANLRIDSSNINSEAPEYQAKTILTFPNNNGFECFSVNETVQTDPEETKIVEKDPDSTPPTITVDGGEWNNGDKLSKIIPYDTKITCASDKDIEPAFVGESVMTDGTGSPGPYTQTPYLLTTDEIESVSGGIEQIHTMTVSGWGTPGNILKCDGDGTSTRGTSQNNTPGTLVFDPPLANVTRVRVYTRFINGGSYTFTYGDNSTATQSQAGSGTQWYELYNDPSNPITLKSYSQVTDTGASDDFWAIEINGTSVCAPSVGDTGTTSGTINITTVTDTVLTLSGSKDLEYFRPGDVVQVGEVSFSPGNMNGYNALDQAGVNNMFDGNLETQASILSQSTYPGVVPNDDAFTVVLPAPIANVTKVEVYGNGSSNTNTDAWINDNADPDSNTISSESNAWHEIYNGAAVSLTKLRFATATSNGGMSIRAVRVNGGSPLVYSGTTASVIDTDVSAKTITVSGGNWDASNQSQVWSAGANVNWFNPVSVVFDGDLTTDTWNASGNVATLAFTGLTAQSSIKAYFYTGATNDLNNNYWQINNRNISLLHPNPGTSADAQWVDVSAPFTFPVDITELSARGSSNGGMMALMVDGKLLVDAVNDSQVWSDPSISFVTDNPDGSNSGFVEPAGHSIQSTFSGTIGQGFLIRPVGTGFYNLKPPSAMGTISKLEVNVLLQAGESFTLTLGDRTQEIVQGDGWQEMTNLAGFDWGTETLQITNSGSSRDLTVRGFKLNGEWLVDTGARGLGDTNVKYQTKGGAGTAVGVSGNDIYLNNSTDRDERWIKGYKVAGPQIVRQPTLTADIELTSSDFAYNPTDPDVNPGVAVGDQRFVWTINGVEQAGVNQNPWKPGNLQTSTAYTVKVRHEDYSQKYLKSPDSASFTFTTGAARNLTRLYQSRIDELQAQLSELDDLI